MALEMKTVTKEHLGDHCKVIETTRYTSGTVEKTGAGFSRTRLTFNGASINGRIYTASSFWTPSAAVDILETGSVHKSYRLFTDAGCTCETCTFTVHCRVNGGFTGSLTTEYGNMHGQATLNYCNQSVSVEYALDPKPAADGGTTNVDGAVAGQGSAGTASGNASLSFNKTWHDTTGTAKVLLITPSIDDVHSESCSDNSSFDASTTVALGSFNNSDWHGVCDVSVSILNEIEALDFDINCECETGNVGLLTPDPERTALLAAQADSIREVTRELASARAALLEKSLTAPSRNQWRGNLIKQAKVVAACAFSPAQLEEAQSFAKSVTPDQADDLSLSQIEAIEIDMALESHQWILAGHLKYSREDYLHDVADLKASLSNASTDVQRSKEWLKPPAA